MNKKIVIVLSIVASVMIFLSFRCGANHTETQNLNVDDLFANGANDTQQTTEEQKEISYRIYRALTDAHYEPKILNEDFSKKIFDKYLERADYSKSYFNKKEVDEFAKYKTQLCEQFKNNDLSFYAMVYKKFLEKQDLIMQYYNDAISKPQDFTSKGNIQLDGKKLDWCKNDEALQKRWQDAVKYRVLTKYIELQDNQNSKKDTVKDWKVMSNQVLEDSARKVVKKSMDLNFKRIKKIGQDEYFSMYINTICNLFDPHTEYFAPAKKTDFDVQMSGTFFGIGAVLKDIDGVCTIQQIMTGSPSWKQGSLKANDKILKVGQGKDEPVEIGGWDINDVIKVIRGKKGTEVRLYTKHADGKEEVIPIIRDVVHVEDVFAKSAIVNDNGKKIGYIHLPEFYNDFSNAKGKKCAQDIKNEVLKLKEENIDGIVIDLRYNGGGSLSDVVDIATLFVGNGPQVLVKSKGADANELKSNPNNVNLIYDGPLAIMVNNYSASASEILAAALQDYKRAVIIGNTTYGKGTVQRQIDLREIEGSPLTTLGSLKLTLQKFYRVNGGSTQLKGVTPDVILPDLLMYLDKGERSEPSALGYDEIPAPNYKPTNSFDKATIVALSKKRIDANNYFKMIDAKAMQIKQQEEDNVYSLNEGEYRKQLQKIKDFNKKLEDLDKDNSTLDIYNPRADMDKVLLDDASKKKNEDWLKALKKDANLKESLNVIKDIIQTKK